LTALLTTWAAKHQVQLWVAGDKAYGEFRETTLNPDASVKFLVTGKKGKFAVKTQTASNPRSKKKPKAPSSSKKRKPVVKSSSTGALKINIPCRSAQPKNFPSPKLLRKSVSGFILLPSYSVI
jgi:hypothetical protein